MSLIPHSNFPDEGDDGSESSTVEAPKTRLHARQVIGERYEIVERLGRGHSGEVWRAYDLKLRVDVALKSVRRTTPEALEALRREVRAAREVVSPNVCRVFDLIVAEGLEFLSMEYIDGQTLLAHIREKSPLGLHDAREIAFQFLAGLEAIHQVGLIHRDLKPENIMITRTGRVVVMDFGIAESEAQIGSNISGTPPYMAPEQLAGCKVDARVDLFAAGIILAEMISTVRDIESRKVVWKGLREEPPKLADGPLQAVLARAVARNPEDRFASARALSNALEEIARRMDSNEKTNPYPGLSSFTAADAEYFLGRELEIESAIKRLQELHLMAIIGPSGAGKTSFLHAGVIPAMPAGWSSVFSKPGDSPLKNVGQALAAEFSGDPEAIRKMVALNDIDAALWLLSRWRQNHSEAILIIDQFEELFTLNDRDTQIRFAELLGEAALKADVRVLLVMRDDFLIFCKEHDPLVPILSELTIMLPLTGEALKRALIEPALRCGYRFEDEELVDEILNDVEKERGTLPLMAFATARLWQTRDRQNGLLLRAAYKEIGGVAGALAQHAEATMDRIGEERQTIVREIFRNLVTAQKTRAVRDAEELFSIFEDRVAAEEILRILIDARLLTSFEPSRTESQKAKRRVEIIHESLLSAWPRLVRWQTQDADHAQFRDQFRQAAHVWDERGRPVDLLWGGSAYKEFEVWRERYAGGLTDTEKGFADAMLQHAHAQRVKRRVFLSTAFVMLLSVLVLIAILWRSEKSAHQEAVLQAQRSEASKLLALGQTELDQDPTIALAYAIASLERNDSQVGRRFAMQALSKGQPAFIMTDMPVAPVYLNFSPDGKWLAVGGMAGSRLLPKDGSEEIVLTEGYPKTRRPHLSVFSPKGDSVAWSSSHDPNIVNVWSVSQRKVTRSFKMEGPTNLLVRGSKLITITDLNVKVASTPLTPQGERSRIRTWSFDENEPRIVADWNWKDINGPGPSNNPGLLSFTGGRNFDIRNDTTLLAYGRDRSIYIRPFEPNAPAPETLVGKHDHILRAVLFHPDGKHIASADITGEIRIWSLSEDSKNPLRTIAARGLVWNLFFNSSGSILAASYEGGYIRLWDMNGPKDADPLILQRGVFSTANIAFDPSDRWVAIPYFNSFAIWPLKTFDPYVLHGDGEAGLAGGFTKDGKWLVSLLSSGIIRLRDMKNFQAPARDLKNPAATNRMNGWDLDPTGKYLAIASHDGAFLVSISDGETRRMPGIGAGRVSFSPNGRFLAAESYGQIPLWDIQTNQLRILKKNNNNLIESVVFSPDGSLFSGHSNGDVYQWNVEKETSRLVAKGNKPCRCKVPQDNPHILVCLWFDNARDFQKIRSEIRVINLQTGNSYPITTHGNRVAEIDVDTPGTILVTVDLDGIIRIGPITGDEEPHLLFGNKLEGVSINPDGQWIASSEVDKGIIRLWRMPKGRPIHTLPYDQLLKKLRSLTNVRIVADEKSSTDYRIQFDRFPGWEKVPSW